jgi:hypothetical protein
MLTWRLPLIAAFSLMLCGDQLLADATISPGTSRADLLAKQGNPKSKVVIGAKEIMHFPEGKVVLVNGVVTSFEAAAEVVEPTDSGATASADNSGAAVTVVHTNYSGWLTDPEMAQAHARMHHKNILVLLTGDMRSCPNGVRFNQEITNGISFARMMTPEFILLKLDFSAMGGSADAPIEIGSLAHQKLRAKLAIIEELFPAHEVPSMAILSADGKGVVPVDLSVPTSKAGYSIVLDSTLRAVKAAKDRPWKTISLIEVAKRKFNFVYVAVLGVVVFLVVRRFR